MRFKVDENLPFECVVLLREAGHDVVSAQDQGLGGAQDPRVAQICADEKRVLVSLDLDSADMRTYPPSASSGIVVFRLRAQAAATLRRLASRLLEPIPRESPAGKAWIVEEDKV